MYLHVFFHMLLCADYLGLIQVEKTSLIKAKV